MVQSKTPYTCLRKDCVCRHRQSLQHEEAAAKELAKEDISKDGGIQQGFKPRFHLRLRVTVRPRMGIPPSQ